MGRWAENVVWQHFSGMRFYEPRLPCDATQIGRFRSAIGEAGVEELLKATIDTAVTSRAIKPAEFERLIVDTTVQEKAITHPVDSRLLEIARHKVVAAAKRAGIALKQTFVKEGKALRRKAGGYAHAKQFKRLRKVLKRQRTILGVVLREVQRKIAQATEATALTLANLQTLMQRAERIRSQRPKDKNKLYALHAPEVECISKGKARNPYEFGVKVTLATTLKEGLVVGMRSMPGNPYDGHTLDETIEQVSILANQRPRTVMVDKGYKGAEVEGVQILRSGQRRGVTRTMKAMIKRRSAIEPTIGHMKSDGRLARNPLKGALGDALHAVLCGAGHNIRLLLGLLRLFVAHLRAIVLACLGRSACEYRSQLALAAA